MLRALVSFLLVLSLAVPTALASDKLSAREIRRIVPGNWSGTYKEQPIRLSVTAAGRVTGSYAGLSAHGTWSITRRSDGDRLCLTFQSIITTTKCGELFVRGNNVLYGFIKRGGGPRLWLRRS